MNEVCKHERTSIDQDASTMPEVCDTCGNEIVKQDIINQRLEYLRQEIKAERISYGEIAELQSLVKYIAPDDVELLEWAGIKES